MQEASETKARKETGSVKWNIFYRSPDGFGEHFEVQADDSAPIIKGRTQLLDWLKSIGAKPLPRDIDFPSKAPAARAVAEPDPMLRAAQQVLGASISKTCPIHNVQMKRIAGTAETGRVSKNGKPYNAFWVCEAAEGCRGGETR